MSARWQNEDVIRLRQWWTRVRDRRWVRWSIDLALVLLVVGIAGAWQTRGHLSGPAPDFALSTLDGKTVSLASLKGKPVMLAFWAPWCTVCQGESGNLSWVQKLAGERAHIVSVASAFRTVQQVEGYVQAQHVDYPVLLDDRDLASAFHVEAYPTVYFLDEQGQIRHSVVGYTTTGGLLARLWW